MKKLLFTMVFILTTFLIITQSFASRALKVVSDLDHKKGKIGTYRALIIGIQNYNDPKIPDLQTPLKDARVIAGILQKTYGFKVDLLMDSKATRKAMYWALRSLAQKTKPEDSVLIYYAGHGDLDRTYDDGWWIPVDAKGGDPFTYLSNVQVQKSMQKMKARHVLLISDSCYSGTLFGQARAMPQVIDDKYYLNLYNEKSRWGMTSGNKTPVSDSGTGGHSVFAYQLIRKLRINNKPYISTREIYTDIAPIIANNSEQTPLCRPIKGTGDQGGEFIFVSLATPNKQDALIQLKGSLKVERKKIEEERKALEKLKQKIELKKLEQERKELASLRVKIEQEKLEQEQKEKEKLKTKKKEQQGLELERKKLEAEKKQLQQKKSATLASSNPAEKNAEIIARDGHYVKYTNGIVYDKKTGLEWYTSDKDMGWYKTKSWISSLNVDGRGWEMPSIKELRTLYKQRSKSKYNMTSLLNTSHRCGWYVESSSGRFDFYDWDTLLHIGSHAYPVKSFAVRKKKN